MDYTIIGQGTFTAPSTIVNQVIQIPSNVDWMKVYNYTQMGTASSAATGQEFYWQRGMAAGTGIVKYTTMAGYPVLNIDTLVSGGFTLYDPSGQSAGAQPLLSAAVNFTAITNVTRPVVSTASTAGLAVGSIVRLSSTLANGTAGTSVISDIAGMDFVVGAVVANTSFTLLTAASALANAPGLTTGTGSWRIVNYFPLYYPYKLLVTNITGASSAVVSTSIPHGLTPGQAVRFSIPKQASMVQLNPTPGNNYLYGIITAVGSDETFTVNINTTAFTAFTYPTVAQQPSSFPIVEPIGEDTATSLVTAASQVPTIAGIQINGTQSGLLADATVNTAFLGMILGTGGNGNASGSNITGPAGTAASDVVYWVAGKSTYGGL